MLFLWLKKLMKMLMISFLLTISSCAVVNKYRCPVSDGNIILNECQCEDSVLISLSTDHQITFKECNK